jgi:hypothetical protein
MRPSLEQLIYARAGTNGTLNPHQIVHVKYDAMSHYKFTIHFGET